MVVVAVNSWGQSTNPNVQWNNGTLTITYYDGVIDDIKNGSIFPAGSQGNVTKLVMIGAFDNEFFSTEGPAESFFNRCTSSTLYLDLEQCTGIASKVVSTTGSDEIDWSNTNNYKYTTPNRAKVVGITDWYFDQAFTNKIGYGEERVYQGEDGNWYWTGWDGDTPKRVYPKTQQGYYLNGNFPAVNP